MSKPATQKSTASPRTKGASNPSRPRIAIHAATGASSNEAPSQKCARNVKRFVSEYAQMNRSTGRERYSGHGLAATNQKIDVLATNAAAHTKVNAQTAGTLKLPVTRCR